ncbi:insulinase family protein [Rickettsiales bacterium]|nr:insulinase family protein [Rickettsiales bacterium]
MIKIIKYYILLILIIAPGIGLAALPEVKIVKIDDNIEAWTIEDNYLPIISARIAFKKAGYAYDPQERLGLAYLVSGMLDEGAGKYSAFEFKAKLEELAVKLSFDIDEENFYISLTSLTENFQEAISILTTAITEPHFEEEILTRIRNQIKTLILKQREDPEFLAEEALQKGFFGDHPYGRSDFGEISTLDLISEDDLKQFVKERFVADNIVVSIVGDIKNSDVPEYIKPLTDSLEKTGISGELPDFKYPEEGRRISIKKDMPQSVVVFAMPGVLRSDPRFYPAYMMNHILGGGGFESRLMKTIREKNGLAYSMYTTLGTLPKAAVLTGYFATKNKTLEEAINLLKQEISDLKNGGVSLLELKDTKDYMLNSFPIQLTKNSKLAYMVSKMQLDNLGVNFLKYRDEFVKEVDINEVDRTAYEILDVDKMIIVVVGGDDSTSKADDK